MLDSSKDIWPSWEPYALSKILDFNFLRTLDFPKTRLKNMSIKNRSMYIYESTRERETRLIWKNMIMS